MKDVVHGMTSLMKEGKTLPASIGEIEGFSSDFFVVSRSSWYDLYDDEGKKYKTLPESIGQIVAVSGNTFVVRRSSWHDTYDSTGKKINTKPAR